MEPEDTDRELFELALEWMTASKVKGHCSPEYYIDLEADEYYSCYCHRLGFLVEYAFLFFRVPVDMIGLRAYIAY